MPGGADRGPVSWFSSAARRVWPAARAHPRLAAAVFAAAALAAGWMLLQAGGRDESLARVKQSGVLRVGLEATFPPFETTDGQGNFGGFDIDVAHAIAAELGVQPRFDNLSYDTLYDALAVQRVDVLISMIIVERERTQDVTYSPPYYDAGQVLATSEGSPVTGVTMLAGRRVAVEAGSMAEEEARRLAAGSAGMAIVTFSEPGLALAALAQGEAEAAITDPVSLAAFRKAGGKAVAVERVSSEPYVVAARRQDRSLVAEIERIVGGMEARGDLARLADKWF